MELSKGKRMRREAIKNGCLPYSFNYKIRQAFIGEPCPICHCLMGVAKVSPDDPVVIPNPMPTIQHNLPIVKGGKHELSNISVICHRCNVSLKDTETGELNNKEVVKVWERLNGRNR